MGKKIVIELGENGRRAVELFNNGDLRECHYILEKIWVQSHGEKKDYIQGLVQIIAGIFKIRIQSKRESAIRLLRKGSMRLEKIDPDKSDLDIRRLKADTETLIERLEGIESEGLNADELSVLADSNIIKMYFH